MLLASIYARARGEEPSPALEHELREAIETAHAQWPTVHLTDAAFVGHLARAGIHRATFGDVYLACACGTGDPAALAAFERAIVVDVKRSLSRTVDAATLDDALQGARRDLFALGRIAQYDGRGPLKAWFRVAVLRLAVRASEARKREASLDEPADLQRVADADPELLLAKAMTRDAFRAAFQAAVDALDPREALVLRQHFVDDLSIDELGRLHRVHRATAARWVVRARENLLERMRSHFSQRVSEDECESAIRLISSQFDVSVKRMLLQAAQKSM